MLNVLTEIRLPDYSAGMISEFTLLMEKVRQLAEVSHALRLENAELRGALASQKADNAQLTARVGEAYDRVAALLDTLPAQVSKEEAA